MITKSNFGKHESVLFAEFGTGDIKFTRATFNGEEHESALIFHNAEPGEIGRTSRWDEGETTDELERPELVMRFTKPESITALIHSLIELQKEVFSFSKDA